MVFNYPPNNLEILIIIRNFATKLQAIEYKYCSYIIGM